MTDQQVSSPPVEVVASWLQSLRQVVDGADQILEWAQTSEITPEETLGVYAEFADLVKALDWQRRDLMNTAAHMMDDDTFAAEFINGLDTRVLRKSASRPRRKWDNEGLFSTVRRKVIDQAGDAGADIDTVAATIRALSDIYRLSGGTARLTVLREMEIDYDEYCETGEVQFRVEVTA